METQVWNIEFHENLENNLLIYFPHRSQWIRLRLFSFNLPYELMHYTQYDSERGLTPFRDLWHKKCNWTAQTDKLFTVRSAVLTELRNFCLPKICQKNCYKIWESNIKMDEGTELAQHIACNGRVLTTRRWSNRKCINVEMSYCKIYKFGGKWCSGCNSLGIANFGLTV
jgi:hypothetical protein